MVIRDLDHKRGVPCLPQQAYLMKWGQDQYDHTIGGAPSQECPQCPNCEKPIYQLAKIDARDPRLEGAMGLRDDGIPLLYCWRCNIPFDEFCYRLNEDGSIDYLRFLPGFEENDSPRQLYYCYPDKFDAEPVKLVKMSRWEQSMIRKVNRDLADPFEAVREDRVDDFLSARHQVGGEPIFIQGLSTYWPTCIGCSELMPIFASIGNDHVPNFYALKRNNLVGNGFAGNDGIQHMYHLCLKCRIVTAHHHCD